MADISTDVGDATVTHTALTPGLRAEQDKFVVEKQVSMTSAVDVVLSRSSQVSITSANINSQLNYPVRDTDTARPDVCLRQTETSKHATAPTSLPSTPVHTPTTNLAVVELQPACLERQPHNLAVLPTTLSSRRTHNSNDVVSVTNSQTEAIVQTDPVIPETPVRVESQTHKKAELVFQPYSDKALSLIHI